MLKIKYKEIRIKEIKNIMIEDKILEIKNIIII